MMTRYGEICLVEVSAQFIAKGGKVHIDLIDDLLWKSQPEYEKLPAPLKGQLSFIDIEAEDIENLVVFTSDNVGLEFQNIGQGTDERYSSAISRTIDHIGIDEVFQDWLDALEEDGFALLGEINKTRLKNSQAISNFVRFVTAWDFVAYGDYEEEWNYLGMVDLTKIPGILTEETPDEKP